MTLDPTDEVAYRDDECVGRDPTFTPFVSINASWYESKRSGSTLNSRHSSARFARSRSTYASRTSALKCSLSAPVAFSRRSVSAARVAGSPSTRMKSFSPRNPSSVSVSILHLPLSYVSISARSTCFGVRSSPRSVRFGYDGKIARISSSSTSLPIRNVNSFGPTSRASVSSAHLRYHTRSSPTS